MPEHDPRASGLEIRSFHVVFRLERRLHRIDRWRLPFPHGVPVGAIAHGALVLLVVVAVGRLPGIGAVIAALPAPLAYVLIPGGSAAALTRLRIDGRPAHRHLLAHASAVLARRRTAGQRTAPTTPLHVVGQTLIAHGPDRSGFPHSQITGPATVGVLLPARAHARARMLHLTPRPGRPLQRPRTIRLAAGQRLRIGRPR
jgi:hypothetical protein